MTVNSAVSAAEWLSDPARGVAKVVRPAQITMTSIVERILSTKGIALIEAGTGTGKSLAYLTPSILSGKRVIISTAKKALQEQLCQKDVPFLYQALGIKPSFASIKGKGNYACRMRWDEFESGGNAVYHDPDEIEAFGIWLDEHKEGDLDSYPRPVKFLPHVRVTECVAKWCMHAGSCGYRTTKNRLAGASIVIANHALVAYDLAMGGGVVLGAYDALIIDEAHQAPEFFRGAHTCKIHEKLPALLRNLLGEEIAVPTTLEAKCGRFLGRLPEKGLVTREHGVLDQARALWSDLDLIKRSMIRLGVWSDDPSSESEVAPVMAPRALIRVKSAAAIVRRMIQACDVVVEKLSPKEVDGALKEAPTDYAMYVEMNNGNREFIATPIEIGPLVRPSLKHIETVIITSATLSTGGNFDYISREFGLFPSDVTHKEILPPTFDYAKQSCLYVPSDMPEFKRDTRDIFWDKITERMHELLTASKGGAFILCSSYEDMMKFHDGLTAKNSTEYRVKAQTGGVDGLIQWFKDDMRSVAIGMKSIWEGVDIPGMGLRLVIIPRLPFPNPDDPVFKSKKQAYVKRSTAMGVPEQKADLDSWKAYDLQQALMDFKQGVGRLIRRETDQGVVALLDARAYGRTKSYSGTVRAAAPHPVTSDLPAVLRVLQIWSRSVKAK